MMAMRPDGRRHHGQSGWQAGRDPASSTDDRREVRHMEGSHIRVLLVDDHGVVRRGLRGYLELLDDIEVVGEAENGLLGVEMSAALNPDVILMDLVMPQLDGIGAIARIKEAQPKVQIVALTSFIEEKKVTAALEAGANGFILKDADADDVAAAIRAAYNDEVHLDPAAARILARGLRHRNDPVPADILTERELEVLGLVGRGRSNKEIATDLGITERTARTHVSNILGKLDLQSRTQAALYAVERKLIYD
jgi:DNA-binding NarL/FixJ family response regulator